MVGYLDFRFGCFLDGFIFGRVVDEEYGGGCGIIEFDYLVVYVFFMLCFDELYIICYYIGNMYYFIKCIIFGEFYNIRYD